ncbi:MAG: type III-A CRISPR-associated RAMP protein Csm4, partial [Cyanobacteria bacterium J06573_2]
MSEWKLVRLNFGQNKVHFGRLGIGIEETNERLYSDSLFSALITAYARLFPASAVTNLLEKFQTANNPPFRISSTFVYQKLEDTIIDYLPKPLRFPCNYPDEDLQFAKTYKKLKYLPADIWHIWYQKNGFISSENNSDSSELIQQSKNKSSGKLRRAGTFSYGSSFEKMLRPKISVDRITAATNLYHTGFVQFKNQETQKSGLYFLIQFPQPNEKLESDLKAALHLLAETGLGGERSSGAGQFNFEWFNFSQLNKTWQNILKSPKLTHHTLISLFWDSSITEEFLQNAAYEIQECGGWIAQSNIRRQKLRMFAEGSVFSEQPQGK